MKQIQFIQYTPEQLQAEIQKGIHTQLNEFLEHFKSKESNELFTRSELANFLKVDLSTIHNWCKNGKLKPLGLGARVYFRKSDIENSLIPINTK